MSKQIVHITPAYLPHRGGVETHVQQVSRELLERGYDVTVLTTAEAALPSEEIVDGVKVIRMTVPSTQTSFIFPWLSGINYKLQLWRQVLQHAVLLTKADVIQVHDVLWWLLPLWPFVWVKTHLTFHGWEGVYPIPWRYKFARWCWSQLATSTVHVGNWIREFYWDLPDAVTYGGSQQIGKIVQTKRTQNEYSHSEVLNIVFVGRLEAVNGVNLYLELIMSLQQHQLIQMTWVGDGSLRKECEQVGLVTGMISDVDRYIREADLVFANSYLSMLDAQAEGKIVVALYQHYLKQRYLETYPGQQFLLLGANPEDISMQLQLLFKQPQLMQQYQQRAAEWAEDQTWYKVVLMYEQLWKIS